MSRRGLAVAVVFVVLASALPASAVTRSWTGAASALWSDPANWSPAGVPAAADTLVFPAGVSRKVMRNDLPSGTAVGPMAIRDRYTLDGNAVTLTGDLTFDYVTRSAFVCNADVTLGARVRVGYGGAAEYNGAFDVNGHTLTLDVGATFNGPLNGSGTIISSDMEVSVINGTGSFAGTLDGTFDVSGSIPNATFVGSLTGQGVIGNVTIRGATPVFDGGIFPGRRVAYGAYSVGTLQTKSISLRRLSVDLVSPGPSDQVKVTGSVSVDSLLTVAIRNYANVGQTFVIIDNDGTDAVSGTFSGLPEGAEIAAGGGTRLAISYRGGDGNDIVLTVVYALKGWIGTNSSLWSDPGNWYPVGVPAPGQALMFGSGALRKTVTYDLAAGREVGQLDIGSSYTFNGTAMTLRGDVKFSSSAVSWTCDAPLVLAGPVRIGRAVSRYNGGIHVNGHTLTIDEGTTIVSGPIHGSGSVVLGQTDGVALNGGGTFSGTIHGTVAMRGAMPNATFIGSLSGSGTIGAVTLTPGTPVFDGGLYPGMKCCGGFDAVGTLSTGSLTFTGSRLQIDLVPGGTSDRVAVTGSVSIANTALFLTLRSGAVSSGDRFIIIDNDGTDPVSGTFFGLPEGSGITLGTATLTISYRGGDGNDVVLAAAETVKSWRGTNSALWSDPANWSPARVPVAGEVLLFPAGAARTTMTNDLPAGFTVGSLTFSGDYRLSGNALTLMGDIAFDPSGRGRLVSELDLRLGAPLSFGASSSEYSGAVDVNGHTLTIASSSTTLSGPLHGSGTVILELGAGVPFRGGGTFRGTIRGPAHINGSMPDAAIVGSLSGTGSVGAVTITPGTPTHDTSLQPSTGRACCGGGHTIGALSMKSLSLGAPLIIDLTANGTSDQIKVAGAVGLGEAALFVYVTNGSPVAGQTFTIIDNDGTDPIAGTFAAAAEGSVLAQGPWKFRVSYAGGDGNDVVLTTIEDTVVTPEQNRTSTNFGETATITAKVTGRASTPVGTASLTENGVVLESAPLVNGFVSFAAATLDPGVHTLGVVYAGTAVYTPSAATITHEVLRGKTTTAVSVGATSIVYGDPLAVSVQVAPVAPAVGTPSGSVTLRSAGSSVGAAVLNGSAASIPSLLLGAGTHAITAAYDGDARFAPSDSASASVVVARAPTVIVAAANDERTPAGTPVQLAVSVSVANRREMAVSGVVTVSANGSVLLEQSIEGNAATLIIPPLPAGEHHLLVSYGGSANFEASSTTVTHAVGSPTLFVRDVIVEEGNAGETTARIAVELSATNPRNVTVFYATTDGSARAGEDYRPAEGMLTFLPGETAKVIEVKLLGDAKAEDDETLTVTLFSPAEAKLGRATATVTIANEDLTYRTNAGIVYANPPTGPLTLDLYTPVDGSGPFPLIVWVPGGASYDPNGSIRAAALRATGRGYAVAVVRYRAPRVARFPAQLDDLRDGIRWLRAHAAGHRLDADRIAAWGFSSGAHLASLLGTTGGDEQVQAVVAWGGPSDLTALQRDADAAGCTVNYNDRNSAQSLLLGCVLPSCAESAAAASPLSFVTRDDAAFLIMHAPDDCSSIPSVQSRRLYEALRAAGGTATLRAIDDASTTGWAAPSVTAVVETFLDAQLKARSKRRATRH